VDLKELGCKDVNWIHVTQDKDQWQAVVNMDMKFLVAEKVGNFLIS
jgi:hypothetical protein